MISKDKYLQFCLQEKAIPIFSQPWWLNAVCGGENWDVILIEKGNEIVASFPYYMAVCGMLKMQCIEMPTLTQKLGPYIKYPQKQKLSSKLSYEKDILQQIVNELPIYDTFAVHFDHKYTNWLPFYWNGFQQTTRYTYIVDDLSNSEKVFEMFSGNKKTDIRKAKKKVTIKYDLGCEEFLDYYCKSLTKLNDQLTYSKDLFRRLYYEAIKRQQGRTIYAVAFDNPNDIYGAIFYVWDNESIYSLVTAFDPDYRNSAASSLLFYQIMKDNKDSGLKFDFEGSMVEKIENSYSKFGTRQVQYFRIAKINSRKYNIYNILLNIRNVIKH